MAKRNTRKTDHEIASTPESREASPTDPNTAAAPKPTRSRRKAASVAPAATQSDPATEVTRMPAEGAVERAATAASTTRDEGQPRTAASSFTTVAEVAAVQLSHDQIAERAYHLYLERDRQPGDPFADWLTAERELRERFVGA